METYLAQGYPWSIKHYFKKKKKFNYHKLKVPQQPQYARLITIMDADILSSSHTVGFAIQNHD